MSRPAYSLSMLLACVLVLAGGVARAEGLRITTSFAAMKYDSRVPDAQNSPDGTVPDSAAAQEPINLYFTTISARVARGRAGLAFSVPIVGVSGGGTLVSSAGDTPGVDTSAPPASSAKGEVAFGVGDMSVGLDYNLIQNRQKMFIVTLGGNMRFSTASSNKGIGTGEEVVSVSLSSVYGITRQLLAFAEARQAWAGLGVLRTVSTRMRSADLGAVYWITDGFGVTASASAADYAGRIPASFELNAGVMIEALPGLMMNVGGVGGVAGSAPQLGGNIGFGFDL